MTRILSGNASLHQTRGETVLAEVRRLEDEFYTSEASNTAPDLQSMGEHAAAEFRVVHPEIGEDVVQAFAWSYTYDFK